MLSLVTICKAYVNKLGVLQFLLNKVTNKYFSTPIG